MQRPWKQQLQWDERNGNNLLRMCNWSKTSKFHDSSLNYPISQTQFYTDSTIVLAWVGSHASRWKTFVANRVAKIQTFSSATQWHHISGSANPADLATRGVSSSTLLTPIWLRGPKFLHERFPVGS
ncbi:integrase catalytic domain-containing protein [Trichonephila clavipes]|nr:integrase catalytic domain-containing protein [Trichonephila clavipes]